MLGDSLKGGFEGDFLTFGLWDFLFGFKAKFSLRSTFSLTKFAWLVHLSGYRFDLLGVSGGGVHHLLIQGQGVPQHNDGVMENSRNYGDSKIVIRKE
jgi:hypothetical protein